MSTTKLDGGQVLQAAFDEPTQSLKTTISANVSGAQEVIISYVDDSVQVKGPTGNTLKPNADGSLPITGTISANILGLPTFKTSQYTINLTAVQLAPTPLTNRSSIIVKCVSTTVDDSIYIGDFNVSSSTGYILYNRDTIVLDLTPTSNIYAIGSSAGQKAFVVEVG